MKKKNMNTENDSVKELTDQHWNYIHGVLETSIQDTAVTHTMRL